MAQLGSTTINGDLGVTGAVSAQRYNATSDRRLKTNIKNYSSGKSILELNIYEFDYIDSGGHTIGCLADELRTICPEIVNETPDGYLTIQESKLIYLLLEEVKRLRVEVDALKGGK